MRNWEPDNNYDMVMIETNDILLLSTHSGPLTVYQRKAGSREKSTIGTLTLSFPTEWLVLLSYLSLDYIQWVFSTTHNTYWFHANIALIFLKVTNTTGLYMTNLKCLSSNSFQLLCFRSLWQTTVSVTMPLIDLMYWKIQWLNWQHLAIKQAICLLAWCHKLRSSAM